MLRVRINKSIVSSCVEKRRVKSSLAVAKAKRRDFAIRAALDCDNVVTKKCFTCETLIKCDLKPIMISFYGTVVPAYNAPLICKACRPDKAKFKVARKAMLKFFKWTEEGSAGFET